MLLTQDLIKYIKQRAADPIWKVPGVMSAFAKNWFDVVAVSPHGLIHFDGNPETGWEHIRQRHNYYSHANYFGKDKIGNPSKFTNTSIPIYDFVQVADDVFSTGKKDTKAHSDSEKFDKYRGISHRYTGSNGVKKDFFLVLYKGTKIVHSLYPKDNLNEKPRKRILEDFARCKDKIEIEKKLIEEFYTILIPYENKDKIIRYVVVIRMNENTLLCKAFLQVNALNGVPLYTMYPELSSFKVNLKLSKPIPQLDIEFTRFVNGLEDADFSPIEKVILKVEEFVQYQVQKQMNTSQ